ADLHRRSTGQERPRELPRPQGQPIARKSPVRRLLDARLLALRLLLDHLRGLQARPLPGLLHAMATPKYQHRHKALGCETHRATHENRLDSRDRVPLQDAGIRRLVPPQPRLDATGVLTVPVALAHARGLALLFSR